MMRLKRGFLVLAAAAMVTAVMSGCPGGGNREPPPDIRISLDRQGTQNLGSAFYGYQADVLTPFEVTVINEGTHETGELSVDLGGSPAFEVSSATIGSIAAGDTGRFTITPVVGLGIATHSAVVTVSGANDISEFFVATFTVNERPPRGIELVGVGASHAFPALAQGYLANALTPLNVIVRNVGLEPTGDLTVAVTGANFETSVATISSLAVDAEGNFNVSPIEGLTEGTHSATVTVSGTAGLDPVSFGVTFRVSVPSEISMVEGGTGVSFAILSDGTLWSWGNNTDGMAGTGIAGNVQATPAQVYGGLEGWVHVSSRNLHTLAIREVAGGRHLYAWGNSQHGRLGIAGATGNVDRPTRVGTDTDWQYVSAGGTFSVGIKTDGTLWFWGNRLYGGWGGMGVTDNVLVPTRLGTLDGWVAVSAGIGAVGAIRQVGTERWLYMWGANSGGELGPGILPVSDSTPGEEVIGPTEPVRLGTDGNWESISIGNSFALAIRSVGTERHLYSWGRTGRFLWHEQPPPQWVIDEGLEEPDGDGRLGQGPATTELVQTPTRVGNYTDWHSASAGYLFGVGLRGTSGDLRLMGWGSNLYGRAGQGIESDTVRTFVPTQIGTDTDWTFATASSNSHGLAIRPPLLFGWGSNTSRELGLPGDESRTSPVQITVP